MIFKLVPSGIVVPHVGQSSGVVPPHDGQSSGVVPPHVGQGSWFLMLDFYRIQISALRGRDPHVGQSSGVVAPHVGPNYVTLI